MFTRRELLQGALAAAIASVASACARRSQPAAPPHPLSNLIPAPLQVSTRDGELRLRSGSALDCADPSLARSLERFRAEVVRRTGLKLGPIRHVSTTPASGLPLIRVELARDSDLDLLPAPIGVSPAGEAIPDERHSLTIGSETIVVRGVERAGVVRGLTTLLQLVSTVAPAADGAIVLPAARILDAPRFAWRGLTLDVARTFRGAGEVMRVVDLMALYKLNVLDLPLTGDLYTATELRQLVTYALERSITVVPGLADATTAAERLGRVAAILPSPFVHIGGRAPDGTRRGTPPSDVEQLRAYVHSLGKRTVGWQQSPGEVAATDLVQYWNAGPRLYPAPSVEEGNDTPLLPGLSPATAEPLRDSVESTVQGPAPGIVSPLEHCFLDVPYAERSAVASQESLRRQLGERRYAPRTVAETFDWEPVQSLGYSANDDALAGVSGVIWARSARNFDEMSFLLLPRLAGIAHKAWSTPRENAWNQHRKGLAAHRRLWLQDRLTFFQTSVVDWE
jgi:hexosaminidase